MKKGKTLQELAIEIERQNETKKDYVAPVSKIEMIEGSGGLMLALGDKPFTKPEPLGNVLALRDRNTLNIGPIAHAQIGEFAGIPKAYYDRMLEEQPGLLARNVNTWLEQAPGDKRMVRTLDGRARAFLSDRFRPLDNFDLAQAVLPVLADKQLKIVSCEVTERKLYIKAFNAEIAAEIERKGHDHIMLKDQCSPVICISNSEVGFGSLSITSGIFTEGCTNLAFFSDSSMKKYHVGKSMGADDQLQAILTDRTKNLTDAALWAQVRDIVNSAFDQKRFNTLIERVQQTTAEKIGGDVVKVVEAVSNTFGFTKTEGKSVLKHLIEGGDLSRYGVFNAVTRTAEDLSDYDRATEFERAGGKVIELPRNQWEKIAAAA